MLLTARRICVTTLAWVGAFGADLHAQEVLPYLPVGSRVRMVSDGGERLTGNVLRFTADSISVAVGGGGVLLGLPVARLSSLEVSEGRNRLEWTMRGAGIGAVGVGLASAAVLAREDPSGLAGFAGLLAGGVVGFFSGGIVGALLAPEHWRILSVGGARR